MKLRDLPKVELHCHLEACFRHETVMSVGKTLGLDIPQNPDVFREQWLLSSPVKNLQIALARFSDIQKIWCSEEVIERMSFEACQYAVKQGIRIMEFRYSPDFIALGKPHLNFEKIHAAILRGVSRGRHPDLAVGLIGIVQKTLSIEAATKTVEFIVGHADTFVALDFADVATHSFTDYLPMVEKARAAGLNLTFHAGEEPGTADEVIAAIEILGAQRIGHGIHILGNDVAMDLVRTGNICLEVCPTSNWLTGSVSSIAAHPITSLQDAGILLTINSDDPSLFGIDLCHEYEILSATHGFSESDFMRHNEIAASQSFISESEKTRVWPVLDGVVKPSP